MSTHSAVLFDLDGTLLDTANDLTLALNDVVQSYAPQKKFTLLEARRAVGYGSETIFHDLIAQYTPEISYEKFRDHFRAVYSQRRHASTAFFEGVTELLEQINGLKIPWGIVTNKTEAGAHQAAEHFPLLKTAQCIVGCDTAEQPKPAAAPLLYASAQLKQLPQHCLFVGDTILDMEAAYHAQMPVLAVDYGYGVQEIMHGQFPPLAWVHTPQDIINFLNHF